jgi:F0F1-type ATP synthase membrane subunit b/b'
MLALITLPHLNNVNDLVSRAGLIDLDVTVFYYAGLFVILLLVLPNLVFKPMLERMEKREERTSGARHDAQLIRKAADAEAEQFDKHVADEKRKALEERAKLREATQATADETIAQARRDTHARIEAGLVAQHAQATQARAVIENDAREIAESIAQKLVRA